MTEWLSLSAVKHGVLTTAPPGNSPSDSYSYGHLTASHTPAPLQIITVTLCIPLEPTWVPQSETKGNTGLSEWVQNMLSPNMPIWHFDYFWAKGTWKATGVRKTPWFTVSFLRTGDRTPVWNISCLNLEEENILFSRDGKYRRRSIWTKKPCSNNSYLPLVSLYSYFLIITTLCST